jgi:site-specific recombinase XerD
MIHELELQRLAPDTVSSYVKDVEELARYYGRSPDKISIEEIRDYMHHLIVDKKFSYSYCNHKLVAINFFCREVLRRKGDLRVPMKRPNSLPEPLSRAEVSRLIDAAQNRKHRVLMMTAYSTGLRRFELVRLTARDIHSERMLIRVNQGKGRKDRYTLLSERLLNELRDYWREYRPDGWLFLNQSRTNHMSKDTAGRISTLLG